MTGVPVVTVAAEELVVVITLVTVSTVGDAITGVGAVEVIVAATVVVFTGKIVGVAVNVDDEFNETDVPMIGFKSSGESRSVCY